MTKPTKLVNGLPRNRSAKAPPRQKITLAETEGLKEAPFQSQVVELAKRAGFWVYHTHNSRRSEPGMPDLLLVRPPRIVFAELKRGKGGRLSPDQADVLELLRRCPGCEVKLWTPNDWQEIVDTLTRRRT